MVTSTYNEVLELIKTEIQSVKFKIVKKVSNEQINHYLDIGRIILEKQEKEKWGKSVVEKLSNDLNKLFPNTAGYSARNLWDMRRFYARYASNEKLRQLVAEIPWEHNLLILSKIKNDKQAEFYISIKSEYTLCFKRYVRS